MNLTSHLKPLLLSAFVLLLFQASTAQRWIEMAETATNFYTVQDSFYKEWEGRDYEKGKGYKQFKRWEWFMEPRVYPTGKFPNPTQAWKEAEAFNNAQGAESSSGGTWTPVGPSNWVDGAGWNAGNGRINVVVQDPVNTNTVYVGAAAGGLWKSTNGGTTWTNLTDNQAVLGVSGIAIDPTNTSIIYIGTGDGDGSDTYSVGVLKSTDGGTTWNTTGLNWAVTQSRVIRKLQMDPNNSSIIFAATSNGLYKTINAGTTWTQVFTGSAQDVEIHPGNSNIVYTCTDQFYKSTNGGNSFTIVTSGLPGASAINRFKIAVSPDEPNWVYVLGGKQTDHTFEGIYRSTDSGTTFTVGTNTPNMFGYDTNGNDDSGQSWYDMAIAVNPANADEVYIGGVNVWKSTNGGTSFTIITQWTFPNTIGYVHADIHDLAFFGSRIYSGSDGGVYKSENFGDDWTNLSVGITIMQFYDIGGTPQNGSLLIGGAQDNGTNRYNGSPTWTHVIGADGMNCAIDPTNQNIMYGAIQNGSIRRSTNGGSSFSIIVEPDDFPGEAGNWVTPYSLDPNNPATIYVGYKEIYKSTNSGSTWTMLGAIGSTTTTSNLEIAPSNSSYIYITKSASIYKTTNGGTSWTNISAGLPNLFITDIAIDPADPNRLWVTLSGYTAGSKIFQSTNGGSTWTNVSYNLPNLPANCIAFRPNSVDELYIGMDVGLYTKSGSQTNWTACSTGLPNVIINEIEVNNAVGKIQMGSYGRGAWEMELGPPGGYCMPTFDNPCTSGDFIDDVTFATISNLNTGCGTTSANYSNFTTISAALNAGSTYPITLGPGPTWGQYFVAMIDFNGDTDFADAGEFFNIGYAAGGGSVTGSITVPAGVPLGATTLRILCRYDNIPISQEDICGNFDFGEVEDYTISISPPECTFLTNPVNGAAGVPETSALTWAAAGGNPTGYLLKVGTTPGGTQILNNFNVGNVTTYDPPGNFPSYANIYVTITPYNGNGNAMSCAEESFAVGGVLANPSACQLGAPFPDNSCTPANRFPVNVTTAPGTQLGTNVTLTNVKIIIEHTYDGDLDIRLYSPSNVSVELSTDNGGSANNYGNPNDPACTSVTNFSMSASTPITAGTAPFIGTYMPEGNFADFNDGTNPNGVWILEICDDAAVDIGSLEFVELVFAGSTPACTNLTSPANGAANVPANTVLNWAAAAGNPTGYRLDVGTTPGGTDILNNFDVGNVTSYDPPGYLPYGATIFVTIKPYNTSGSAIGCMQESFQTGNCIPNLIVVSIPVPAGNHKSLGELVSNNSTVANGTVVLFISDTGVLLDQNFVVEQGGIFEVVLQSCN